MQVLVVYADRHAGVDQTVGDFFFVAMPTAGETIYVQNDERMTVKTLRVVSVEHVVNMDDAPRALVRVIDA